MEYFAKIQEPKKLRLSMMKAARESIVMIETLSEIEDVRDRKLALIEELKDDFKSIEDIYKEMSNLLSDEKTRKEILASAKSMNEELHIVKSKSKTKSAEPIQEDAVPEVKTKTEADRLEYTLKQIEAKIAELSK